MSDVNIDNPAKSSCKNRFRSFISKNLSFSDPCWQTRRATRPDETGGSGTFCQEKFMGCQISIELSDIEKILSLQQIRLFLQLFGQSPKPNTLSSAHFFHVEHNAFAKLLLR